MIEEILDSHRKMYKNNKNNIFSASQEKKTVDYDDDTEFILNQPKDQNNNPIKLLILL